MRFENSLENGGSMSNIAISFVDETMNILLVASVIATVLTLLAGVIIKLARIRTAVYRHLIWLYLLMGIALLPAIWLYGPKLILAILPAQISEDRALVLARDINYAPKATVRAILAGIWFVGTALMLMRLAAAWYRIRRICRSAEQISQSADFAKLSGKKTRILLTSEVSSPVCLGLLRSVIILPREIYSNCTPEDLQMILTHELAHIQRRDCWISLFQRFMEAVLFFHPLVWYASSRLTQEREQICDNYVLAQGVSPTNYAGLLSRIVELGFEQKRFHGVALFEGSLLSRIRSLLKPNHKNETKVSLKSILLSTLVVSVCFCALCTIRLAAEAQASILPPLNMPRLGTGGTVSGEPSYESEDILSQLELFDRMYVADLQGKFPNFLRGLFSSTLDEELDGWVKQNVEYLGKGRFVDTDGNLLEEGTEVSVGTSQSRGGAGQEQRMEYRIVRDPKAGIGLVAKKTLTKKGRFSQTTRETTRKVWFENGGE